MILSDKTLKSLLKSGTLSVSPITEEQIQPASIDVRLGTSFSVADTFFKKGSPLTFDDKIKYKKVEADEIIIYPKDFVLATTMEYIKLPANLTAFVEGRSSIGRLGLFIQNAGWVDPGFEGEITLELFNAAPYPIRLTAGRRVGQLVFAQLDKYAQNPYSGKYQGQRGATGSLIQLDSENYFQL